ncbi:MAG: polyhydroxybutyrate depolymerase [Polaromonas sp.]|nr:polyhydroxybutyrate depolymerase [Polaromonas sp.]
MMKRAWAIAFAMACLLGLLLAWFVYAPMPQASREAANSRTLVVDGQTRSFVVYAPPGVKPAGPLWLILHGSLMDGPKMRAMLGATFERMARERGAVVVYPTGHEGHFNDGRLAASYSARAQNIDDVGFARAMVQSMAAEHKIDLQRVYAFGYSNGGAMAMRLAAEAPELVAGIIVANANVPTPDNMGWKLVPGRTKAVLLEGTKDPINPYDGGRVTIFGFGDRGTVLSSPDSARWFADRSGIGVDALSDSLSHSGEVMVRQQEWGFPTRVRLVSLYGAGHTVPQANYRFPRFLGTTLQDDAILESAWQLLDAR